MATVEAITNINHDGSNYAAGSTFECSDEQAKALVDVGAAKKAAQAATPTPEVKEEKPAETKAPEAKGTGAAKKAAQAK